MARYGIFVDNALGVSMPAMRALAKREGKDHRLALALWNTGIHEAKIMAALVDVPAEVTGPQMELWVRGLDSWDVCDQLMSNLFDKTPYAYGKAKQWSGRREEFVKRAGFALMAVLAVHDKKADDRRFIDFLPLIKKESIDERNFVKKAVNWALRQIGKRNVLLRRAAIEAAKEIESTGCASGRWIARDALRELRAYKTIGRKNG